MPLTSNARFSPPPVAKSPEVPSLQEPGPCLASLLCPIQPAGASVHFLHTLLPPCSSMCQQPGWPSPAASVWSLLVRGWSTHGPLRCLHQPPEAHWTSLGAQVCPPAHCPLLSDPPQNGAWSCRRSGLWARAPRGHWMTALLQDPATYDSRPSAPTCRGTGRHCLPHWPGSRSPGATLRAAGSWPLATLQGPLLALLPLPDPLQCLLSAFPQLEPLSRPC